MLKYFHEWLWSLLNKLLNKRCVIIIVGGGGSLHEYAITQNIVNICCEEAEKNNALKISSIKLKIGELSGLVPECIQEYFNFISMNTVAQGAKLQVEKMPIIMQCNNCGSINEINKVDFNCQSCGSTDVKIIGGNEFLIDSMEVD